MMACGWPLGRGLTVSRDSGQDRTISSPVSGMQKRVLSHPMWAGTQLQSQLIRAETRDDLAPKPR